MFAIATPTRDQVSAGFAFDLIQLTQRAFNSYFLISQGTLLCNQRTDLVKAVLESGKDTSHILFIDSDMRFPSDTIGRLFAHHLPIVGANYLQRQAKKTTAENKKGAITSKGKKGLEEVIKIGFGVTMIDMEVFKRMPQPWFATPYDGVKFVGEDVFFCTKAQEENIPIYVDHDLSQEVKHSGTFDYGFMGDK